LNIVETAFDEIDPYQCPSLRERHLTDANDGFRPDRDRSDDSMALLHQKLDIKLKGYRTLVLYLDSGRTDVFGNFIDSRVSTETDYSQDVPTASQSRHKGATIVDLSSPVPVAEPITMTSAQVIFVG
jgi:hypothetical protein